MYMTKLQLINDGGDLLFGYLSAATFTAQNSDDEGSFPWPEYTRRPWEPTQERLAEIIDRYFLLRAVHECEQFMGYLNSLLLHDFNHEGAVVTLDHAAKQEALGDLDRAGADFWFTRNGHGVGFWDGDWENGDALTALAKSFGDLDTLIYRGKLTY